MRNIIIGLLISGVVCVAAPLTNLLLSHTKIIGGAAPAMGSCGTGTPSVTGNDSNGTIISGTGTPVSCAINFNKTWGTVPHCFVSDQNNAVALQVSPTATTLTISAVAAIAVGTAFDYFCVNHQ